MCCLTDQLGSYQWYQRERAHHELEPYSSIIEGVCYLHAKCRLVSRLEQEKGKRIKLKIKPQPDYSNQHKIETKTLMKRRSPSKLKKKKKKEGTREGRTYLTRHKQATQEIAILLNSLSQLAHSETLQKYRICHFNYIPTLNSKNSTISLQLNLP